jgi:hypothetical protein
MKSKTGPRRGPLSRTDKVYIEKHMERHTVEMIARHLNRPRSTVEKYVNNVEGVARDPEHTIEETLKHSPEWERYKEEFTPRELDYFEHKYVQIKGQFSDDTVLPTEDTQICQAITLDIMLHRVMREQKMALDDMSDAREELDRLHAERERCEREGKKSELAKIVGDIQLTEDKYKYAHGSVKSLTQRYETYLAKHQAILKDIKGTRDQRIKIFENSNKSFLGFLRALQDEEYREQIGEEAAMLADATDKEQERLAALHTYADGSQDQPFKTPETVI